MASARSQLVLDRKKPSLETVKPIRLALARPGIVPGDSDQWARPRLKVFLLLPRRSPTSRHTFHNTASGSRKMADPISMKMQETPNRKFSIRQAATITGCLLMLAFAYVSVYVDRDEMSWSRAGFG